MREEFCKDGDGRGGGIRVRACGQEEGGVGDLVGEREERFVGGGVVLNWRVGECEL